MDRVELISQLNEILAQEFEVDIATITPEANVNFRSPLRLCFSKHQKNNY